MNYIQTINCPHCNSPIKLNLIILEDGTPRAVILEEHQDYPTIAQLAACGIEFGIEIEN